MSILDSLGAIFSPFSLYYQQGIEQQYFRHQPTCIHGLACPVCMKAIEEKWEREKMMMAQMAEKKKDYERRCKEYMERFRKENHKLSEGRE